MTLDRDIIILSAYLVSAALFILGLRYMGSPATARMGNTLGASGMLLAIIVTLINEEIIRYELIIAGVLVGGVIGVIFARQVKMTAMPQMVAVFNGFGGGASALIAVSEYFRLYDAGTEMSVDTSVTIMLGVLIGTVTFSGSAIAMGKLQEIITGRAVRLPLQNILSALLFLVILGLAVSQIGFEANPIPFVALIALCLVLGVLLVMPIGGADMPVVISLLNSYSGLAAAAAGIRHRQPDPHHRGRACRRGRIHPHPDHDPGHAPFPRERHVWRVWRRQWWRSRQRRSGGRDCARRLTGGSGRSSCLRGIRYCRSRLRVGRCAGAAAGARPC